MHLAFYSPKFRFVSTAAQSYIAGAGAQSEQRAAAVELAAQFAFAKSALHGKAAENKSCIIQISC